MSQHEEDAGLIGDELADLVEQGKIPDASALAYLTGNREARSQVMEALTKEDPQ